METMVAGREWGSASPGSSRNARQCHWKRGRTGTSGSRACLPSRPLSPRRRGAVPPFAPLARQSPRRRQSPARAGRQPQLRVPDAHSLEARSGPSPPLSALMRDDRPPCRAQCSALSKAELVSIIRRPQKLLSPMLPALFVLVVSVSQIGNDPQPPAPPGPPSRPETPYVSCFPGFGGDTFGLEQCATRFQDCSDLRQLFYRLLRPLARRSCNLASSPFSLHSRRAPASFALRCRPAGTTAPQRSRVSCRPT